MDQQTLDGTDISELRRRYRRLITESLPRAAQSGEGWPLHADHCFVRVVLDNVFEDEWYDQVDGRPAQENLSAAQLRSAIDIAERLLEAGPSLAADLNDRSLRWRGHRG
mgnify:CR=1 FL=1